MLEICEIYANQGRVNKCGLKSSGMALTGRQNLCKQAPRKGMQHVISIYNVLWEFLVDANFCQRLVNTFSAFI